MKKQYIHYFVLSEILKLSSSALILRMFFFLFFPCIFISWRLITLQYCSGFFKKCKKLALTLFNSHHPIMTLLAESESNILTTYSMTFPARGRSLPYVIRYTSLWASRKALLLEIFLSCPISQGLALVGKLSTNHSTLDFFLVKDDQLPREQFVYFCSMKY